MGESGFPSQEHPLSGTGLFRVDGMVAVVTGGGTGIGLIMAKTLVQNGAHKVYILGRRKEVLDAAAAGEDACGRLIPVQCDVTRKDSLLAAVDVVSHDSGGFVNLVCANAGVSGPDRVVADPDASLDEWRSQMLQVSMDAFTDTFHVNVTAAWFTMLAFLSLLDAGNKKNTLAEGSDGPESGPVPVHARQNGLGNGKGNGQGGNITKTVAVPVIQSQVLLTSSISAMSRARVARPAYSASKAAIAHLTQKASSMLAAYGIRVNALAPGLFPTPMTYASINGRDPADETPDSPLFIPCKSFGSEEDLAGSLLYLVSRSGAYCNGTTLVVDGGRLSVMNNVLEHP